MYKPRFLSLLAIFLCLTCGVFAQSQATTGNIEGRVVDQNGATVPNVTITAINKDNGFTKTTNSSDEGIYNFLLLPPGNYQLQTAAIQGFNALTFDNVVVSVGGRTSLEINLAVNASTNVVNVLENGEIVETTRTSISTTIGERQIRNLPVNGRSFLDFVTLTPGITRDPTRGGDLAVGGQKGTLNSLQIDGVSNDNTFFGQTLGRTGSGRAPFQFSIESVKEFQINQNGFSSEFGRAGGAVINVITKSGTNQFNGGAFEFYRDKSLNANTPILTAQNRPRPPFRINQFGGRIGGPIVKDRAFFFFTYDGQRSNVPNVIDAPNFFAASTPQAARDLLSPRLNTYQTGRTQDVYLLKGDFNINAANQLSVRFNQQNFTGVNNENSGPLSAEEHSGNSIVKTTTLSGSLNTTFSANLFNELRLQYARDEEPGQSNSTQPEARIQTGGGFLNIGRNNFSPRETTIKRFQFVDNITYIVGRQTFKAGVDILSDNVFNFFPGLFTGQYTFNSYSAFVANTPASFVQNFAGAGTDGAISNPDSREYAFFVQDDFRVTPELTLNLGVRYDYQQIAKPPITNPNPVLAANGFDTGFKPSDKNNIAPRIGFAYAFNEKTVFRGGYGAFYGRTPAILTGTAHTQNGIQVTGINLNCLMATCPVYPNIFTSQPTGVTTLNPNLFFFSKSYKQPLVHQARFSIERQLSSDLSLSVSYLLFRGDNLTQTRDVNLGTPVETFANFGGQQIGSFQRFPTMRPIDGFARIQLFDSTGDSEYNGLAVELKKRLSNRLQFIAAYTFSNAKDNKPDQTAVVVGADDSKTVQNQLAPNTEFGRSDLDIRHRFVFSPVYDTGRFGYTENPVLRYLLSDYQISSIVTLQSGFAYSATVPNDLNRDGNANNDRAPGTFRNQFTTPNIYQVDLRLARVLSFTERFRLTFLAEGFNILNRSNIANVNTGQFSGFTSNAESVNLIAPLATNRFQGPRTFGTERQIQLGIKFDF
ncbi:MAG: TonB-dependent receptor [Pyrinomonadaceae bacterium]|nr:TonB-dependent receptor [Pyrinomonadaceae bacterium]